MLPSQAGWPYLGQGNDNHQQPASDQPYETAPIAQVKMLQRPRPHESSHQRISHHQPNSGPSASFATSRGTAGKLVEPGRQSEQASRKPASFYANDDEWPSIADAESKSFGSQKKNLLQKPSVSMSANNGNLEQATSQKGPPPPSNMFKPTSSVGHPSMYNAQTRTPDAGKAPKAPLKTYKERVDEYSKARLRILGSAFSDDDDKGNHDGTAQDNFRRVIHHGS